MVKPNLLAFLLIVCTNAIPFIWHKRVWKSLRDVCLAYCAISIQTKECIWGNCVDPLTKQCTPFFQQIQAKPLQELESGSFHTVHAIGGTNLVSKGLDIKNSSDFEFVTEIIHRLPNIEGIHRPLCMIKNEEDEYKAISERVITFYETSVLVKKYHEKVKAVYNALSLWLYVNGINIWDYSKGGYLIHNIALNFKGEPTFFDLDNVGFKEVQSEKIERERQWLETQKNRQWKEFINEVAKETGLPKFTVISLGIEECIWGKCVDPLSKKCTPFFQQIQTKPLEELSSGSNYTVFAIGGTNLVSKSLLGGTQLCWEPFADCNEIFITQDLPRFPNIEGIHLPICVTKNEAHEYTMISERVIFLDDDEFRPITDKYKDIVNEVYQALKRWLEANGIVVKFQSVCNFRNAGMGLTFSGEPIFLHSNYDKIHKFGAYYRSNSNFREAESQEIVNDAREKLEILKENRRWKWFINEVAREIDLPPFHKSSELKAMNVVFPMKFVVFTAQLLAFILLFFRLRP